MRLLKIKMLMVLAAIFSCHPAVMYAQNKKVVAHYMEWFKWQQDRTRLTFDHWAWKSGQKKHDPKVINDDGLRDIASAYYPLIGPYDSSDEDVIEYHILTAKACGIDGFVVDWYGTNDSINKSFRKMIDIAAKYRFEAGICYEEKVAFPSYKHPADREEAVDFAVKDLAYVADNYFIKPNYLKASGSPLVFMFNGSGDSSVGEKRFQPDELVELIKFLDTKNALLVKQNMLLSLRELNAAFMWPGSASLDNADWFYRTVAAEKDKGRDFLLVGMVYPGFDDTGVWGWGKGPRKDPREDGMTYQKAWELALKYNPDMLQIVTWNDFEEGTVIEPTFQDRFKYVDETESFLGRYKWHPAHKEDNALPFKLFQLRKALTGYSKPDKKAVKSRLDELALSMFRKKASDISTEFGKIADQIGWKFCDYFDSKNEFAPYSSAIADETNRYAGLFSPPANWAVNCKVESSSFKEFGPENAVDNDLDTRWSSDYKDDESLTCDLGQVKAIGCIILDWETAYAKEYSIVVSENRKDWSLVFKQTNGNGSLETVTFPSVNARYVRFSFFKRATEWGFSLWEVGIYAKRPVKE